VLRVYERQAARRSKVVARSCKWGRSLSKALRKGSLGSRTFEGSCSKVGSRETSTKISEWSFHLSRNSPTFLRLRARSDLLESSAGEDAGIPSSCLPLAGTQQNGFGLRSEIRRRTGQNRNEGWLQAIKPPGGQADAVLAPHSQEGRTEAGDGVEQLVGSGTGVARQGT